MKNDTYFNFLKVRDKQLIKEHKAGGFRCLECSIWVPVNEFIGTHNRNHCFACLWSKHVDKNISGDRLSTCHGGMEPLALTFKHEGYFKQGEIMIVHGCCSCGKISVNRIAADDMSEVILYIFKRSIQLDESIFNELLDQNIDILVDSDSEELHRQLFGESNI
jgi:hypothetical protein